MRWRWGCRGCKGWRSRDQKQRKRREKGRTRSERRRISVEETRIKINIEEIEEEKKKKRRKRREKEKIEIVGKDTEEWKEEERGRERACLPCQQRLCRTCYFFSFFWEGVGVGGRGGWVGVVLNHIRAI